MSGQATFYWHDYETWGLSPSLDRPSQFAGIRTDMDFNIIGEPDMFYCRLSNDYLPSPESALITGIVPETTQSEGISEAHFANQINRYFSQPNTCVVGYNNIRFDDEFSRNIFYRNFFDPYEYSWKFNNSRWDIIDLVRAAYALRPTGINWPINEQGLPSFRLELLTEANGISHEQAHDATSDVFATIAIAKLIKEKCPKLFHYYFELRNKNKVKALIDVENNTPLVHVSGMFGAKRGNLSLIAPVVWHPKNKNAVAVIDLSQDITPLLTLSSDEIRALLYTKHEDLGENLPIPLKLVHINKCPFLATIKTLLPENEERLSLNRELCLKNLNVIKENPQLASLVEEVFLKEKKFDHQNNVDAMLYDGFFSFEDKKTFEIIRNSSPEQFSSLKLSVSDQRFKQLFFNYRARNFLNTLSSEELSQWHKQRKLALDSKKSDYFLRLKQYAIEYKENEIKNTIISSLHSYSKAMFDSIE